MNELPEETNIELDVPDDRDYKYDELFGATEEPSPIAFYPVHIQNQASFPITKMWCSRFGMCHAINAQNEYVKSKDGMRYFELPAKIYWEAYLKTNPKAKTEGATLQSSLEQFKKLGFITGYTKLNTIEEMKNALHNIRPIYTGSQNWNWVSVRDKKIYALRTDWKVVGHIFCIVGYDDNGWIWINSYGANNGRFSIPFNLTNTLFSKYAIHDTRDEAVFAKL